MQIEHFQAAAQAKPKRTEEKPRSIERDAVELLKRYRPAYLAAGGEHIVFNIPNTEIGNEQKLKSGADSRELKRDIVFKAATQPLREIMERNLRNGQEPDVLSPEEHDKWAASTRRLSKKFETFKSFFGPDHVVNQKFFFMKVPITDQVINEIYGDEPAPDVESAWTRVTIQRKSSEIIEKKAESFTGGYLEAYVHMNDEDYISITGLLLNGHDLPPEVADRLAIFQWPGMDYWQQRIEEEPGLKEQLKVLVSKAIDYSNLTGEQLDLFGTENIIVYEVENKLTGKTTSNYKLVDAFFAWDGPAKLKFAEDCLAKLSKGEIRYEEHAIDIANGINYVRMVNLLASELGLPERLKWKSPFSPKALARVGELARKYFDEKYPDTELHEWDEAET